MLRIAFQMCLLRLLIIAMVMLPSTAPAQTDYSAGKSAEQLFRSDCSGCHASPQGLGRPRDARALKGFLRGHYTTNPQSAALLANYVVHARAGKSTIHATVNSLLKGITKAWRKIVTTWSWLIRQLAEILPS